MTGRVIGVDAGGTKLLAGVLDERLGVHHRSVRAWRGTDLAAVLDTMVEAVEEARAADRDVEAVGSGVSAPGSADGGCPFSAAPHLQGGPVPPPPQARARIP